MMTNENTVPFLQTCCSHCFIPLTNRDETKEAPSSSSSTSQLSLPKALSTIFKLSYLKAFDSGEEDEVLSFCPTCGELLSNLYQLYNDFVDLGKINCYLSRKLARMNEIIDRHERRTINCDLVAEMKYHNEECSPVSLSDDDDLSNQLSAYNNNNNNIHDAPQSSSTIGNNNNNRLKSQSTSAQIIFDRHPRIVLTRLSKNYSQLPNEATSLKTAAAAEEEETDFNDDDDYVDDDYVPSDEDIKLASKSTKEHLQESAETVDDSNVKSSSSSYKKKKVQPTTKSKKRKKTTEEKEDDYEPQPKPKKKKNNSNPTSSKKRRKVRNKIDEGNSTHKIPTEGDYYHKIRSCSRLVLRFGRYREKRFTHPNPCWYCKRTDFSTPKDCYDHTMKEHFPIDDEDPLIQLCERCSKITFNDQFRQAHNRRCMKIPPGECLPKMFQCNKCSMSFGTRHTFEVHQSHHVIDRLFSCDKCPYRGKTKMALKSHKTNLHPEETLESLQQMIESRVKCPECGKIYKDKFRLKTHFSFHHTPEGQEKYKRSLKLQSELHKQRKKKRGIVKQTTVCSDCGIDFFSRPGYLNHRRTFHGDIQGEFVCEKCGRAFSTATGIKKHQLAHTEERPFLCQECGKGYKNADGLHRHVINSHTTEGRLKNNEDTRERNHRRKLLHQLLAERQLQSQSQETIEADLQFE